MADSSKDTSELDFGWEADAAELEAESLAAATQRKVQRRKELRFFPVKAGTTLIAFGAVAATIVALSSFQLPSYTLQRSTPTEFLSATNQQLSVCPSSFLGQDFIAGTGQDAVVFSYGELDQNPISTESAGVVEIPNLSGTNQELNRFSPARILELSEFTEGQEPFFAAQSQQISDNRVAGLTATDCSSLLSESWLVGGSTATGRNSYIYLVNPAAVVAPVDLSFFGANGVLANSSVLVPAQSQLMVSVASYVSSRELAIKISSRGAPVAAFLANSVTRVLTPGGADIFPAQASPSFRTVISSLEHTKAEQISNISGTPEYRDLLPDIRIFNPGFESQTASIKVIDNLSGSEVVAFETEIAAESVKDFELESLVDGNYRIIVDSAGELLSSVRQSVILGNPKANATALRSDLNWIQSNRAFSSELKLVLASRGSAVIKLLNLSATQNEISVTSSAGTSSHSIAPGALLELKNLRGEVKLSGLQDNYLSITHSSNAGIAAYEPSWLARGSRVSIDIR